MVPLILTNLFELFLIKGLVNPFHVKMDHLHIFFIINFLLKEILSFLFSIQLFLLISSQIIICFHLIN